LFFVLLFLLLGVMSQVTSSKKPKGPRLCRFKSDRDEIWQIDLQANTHRLTESDFLFNVTILRWRRRRYFTQKSAAAMASAGQ